MLRATGSVIAFDGFLKLYREDRDDGEGDAEAQVEGRVLLPDLKEARSAGAPARPLRAALHPAAAPIHRSEPGQAAGGAGHRPSVDLCQHHLGPAGPQLRSPGEQALLSGGPRPAGDGVPDQLLRALRRLRLHRRDGEKLDDVSGGRIDWRSVLGEFWREFSASVDETKELRSRRCWTSSTRCSARISSATEGRHRIRRRCVACDDGRLSLKLGKFGAFIGCSNYPECRHTRPLIADPATATPRSATAATRARRRSRDAADGDAAQGALWLLHPARRAAARPTAPPRRRRYRRLKECEDRKDRQSRQGAERREAEADQRAARNRSGERRSGRGVGPAVAAARGRRAPGNGRRDYRGHRPLRPVHPEVATATSRSRATTMCCRSASTAPSTCWRPRQAPAGRGGRSAIIPPTASRSSSKRPLRPVSRARQDPRDHARRIENAEAITVERAVEILAEKARGPAGRQRPKAASDEGRTAQEAEDCCTRRPARQRCRDQATQDPLKASRPPRSQRRRRQGTEEPHVRSSGVSRARRQSRRKRRRA